MRLLIAGGIFLIVGALVLLRLTKSGGEKDHNASSRQSQGTTATQFAPLSPALSPIATTPRPTLALPKEKPALSSAPRPVRVHLPQDAGPSHASAESLELAYREESRNAAIAKAHQSRIKTIVDSLNQTLKGHTRISQLDCKTRHCLLAISGEVFTETIAMADALQDNRGLLGIAESMMLHREQEELHFYLRFPAPKE